MKLKRNLGIFTLILLVVVGGFIWFMRKPAEAPKNSLDNNQADQNSQELSRPAINLQPTVDAWASKQSGAASVVIIDLANNKIVASLNPDKVYFAASIYKLYVAYEGYRQIANGTYNINDPYLSGYTRGECLDAMIRESYSPCAEKMWVELGKENLSNKIKAFGIKNTNMVSLQTSAADAAIILQRLFNKQGLNDNHASLFMDSLKTQPDKYRRGLPTGFAKSTVYNKVGWNEQLEWHDTAIVTLPSGHSYVISVLSRSVGSKNIVELAKAIEAKLLE